MKRQRAFMTRAVWETVITKYVVPYKNKNNFSPPTLMFHKDGEPLLNKQLPDFIRFASHHVPDINMDVYTHGLMLPKLKYDFLDLLGSLPNKCRLLVSFHFHNHDGSVNDYDDTTVFLKRALRKKPSNVEVIFASHLIAPQTRESLNAWKDSWRAEEEAKLVTVHANVNINPWTGLMKDVATCEYHGCPYADFGHVFIGATGNVVSCCLDLEEEIVHGNVMVDPPDLVMGRLESFYAAQRRGEAIQNGWNVCFDCHGQKRPDKVKNELIQLGGVA